MQAVKSPSSNSAFEPRNPLAKTIKVSCKNDLPLEALPAFLRTQDEMVLDREILFHVNQLTAIESNKENSYKEVQTSLSLIKKDLTNIRKRNPSVPLSPDFSVIKSQQAEAMELKTLLNANVSELISAEEINRFIESKESTISLEEVNRLIKSSELSSRQSERELILLNSLRLRKINQILSNLYLKEGDFLAKQLIIDCSNTLEAHIDSILEKFENRSPEINEAIDAFNEFASKSLVEINQRAMGFSDTNDTRRGLMDIRLRILILKDKFLPVIRDFEFQLKKEVEIKSVSEVALERLNQQRSPSPAKFLNSPISSPIKGFFSQKSPNSLGKIQEEEPEDEGLDESFDLFQEDTVQNLHPTSIESSDSILTSSVSATPVSKSSGLLRKFQNIVDGRQEHPSPSPSALSDQVSAVSLEGNTTRATSLTVTPTPQYNRTGLSHVHKIRGIVEGHRQQEPTDFLDDYAAPLADSLAAISENQEVKTSIKEGAYAGIWF